MATDTSYPRLICIDYIDKKKVEELEHERTESRASDLKISHESSDEEESKHHKKKDDNKEQKKINQKQKKQTAAMKKRDNKFKTQETSTKIGHDDYEEAIELYPCLRLLCEHEEGWHLDQFYSIISELNPDYCSYLARIMSVIKYGNLATEVQIFQSQEGLNLIKEIESKALTDEDADDIMESYMLVRQDLIDESTENKVLHGLKLCELKNGKVLWLCEKHIEETGACVLNYLHDTNSAGVEVSSNILLDDIGEININII